MCSIIIGRIQQLLMLILHVLYHLAIVVECLLINANRYVYVVISLDSEDHVRTYEQDAVLQVWQGASNTLRYPDKL